MTTARSLTTRILLTEQQLADGFLASLRAGTLDEKYFYWAPLSARAWLGLCSDGAYRNYSRSRTTIELQASEIASLIGPGPIELISLGSGQGDKDLILLQAIRDTGQPPSYLAVDASQMLLELACACALDNGFPAQAAKADITHSDHLSAVAGPEGPPRLILLLGGTLGAFDPLGLLAVLLEVLRPQDRLILDGEVWVGEEVIAGYDNPLNRTFAWAPLIVAGLGPEDGDVRFEATEDRSIQGFYRLGKSFVASRDVTALVSGEPLTISAGDRVEMSQSGKYSGSTFNELLRKAGLRVLWTATSQDARFVTSMVASQ